MIGAGVSARTGGAELTPTPPAASTASDRPRLRSPRYLIPVVLPDSAACSPVSRRGLGRAGGGGRSRSYFLLLPAGCYPVSHHWIRPTIRPANSRIAHCPARAGLPG